MSIFNIFKRRKWESYGVLVTSHDLHDLLKQTHGPGCVHIRDRNFKALPLDIYLKLANKAWDGPLEKYRPEIWDCDDRARKYLSDVNLKWAQCSRGTLPLAHGYLDAYVKKGYHAFIWVLTADRTLTYIEPAGPHVLEPAIFKTPLMGT